MKIPKILALSALALAMATAAAAQTTVSLPDTSQTTTLTAFVSEQATVTVPSTVTFNVTDVAVSTAAPAASVTVSGILLATLTKQLKVSLQANAASFTAPAGGLVTWAASDVSWNAATWTGALTGTAGTLSNVAYGAVVTCLPAVTACSTTGLIFTLAAKGTVDHAGAHTLVMTWKFESIGV